MLDDSRHMPIVIEDAVVLSRLYLLRFCCNVVHKNVVGALQVVPLDEYKSAGDGSKAFLINPVNDFHARGVELEEYGGHGLDVLHFSKLVANLDGHGGAAKGQHVCIS